MKTRFFISGNFTDTFKHIQSIQEFLRTAGFDAQVKLNNSSPPSQEMIEAADVFISVLGIEEGAVKTPFGDTLPQAELTYAIQQRMPIVAFVYRPGEKSPHPRQEHFRKTVQLRLGHAVIKYDSPSELPSCCIELIRAGIEDVAKPLKPNKVFISHTSIDKPIVERIVQRLKQAEILTFYDKHDIGVGASLRKTIRDAITQVGYVLLCLSPAALASKWVRDETAWALEHANHLAIDGGEFVLPVRIKEFEIPQELAFLSDRKYADVAADFETGVSTILAAVMK